MRVKLSDLFFTCTKIGALLLGGGYVIVPLLQSELADKKHWLTKEEIIDFYAMGQCVPGIIAPNTIMFAGYKLRGKTGALCAMLGLTLPPFIVILLLASIIGVISKSVIMNDVFWGVNIAIIILIFLTVKEVWACSVTDKFTFLIFALMFVLSALGISPTVIIILAALAGFVKTMIKRKKREENKE